ncbi:uncharacterized protein LOC117108049 [Anneissia japonica]|uniref:uncharacterized protein LOC117108049 n=1 Tax=Anneissia japonica TaxID=1529436 RepID=UPI0014255184|nr:uncharacterized protein LOC117108049 [Anneissia japonica]
MTSVDSDNATNSIRGYDSVLAKSSVSERLTTTMNSQRNSASEESYDKCGIQQKEEPSKSRPDSPTTTYVTKRLEASTRPEVRKKIDEIVASTQKFNDLEKLLLYLKLPTGSSLCTKPKDKHLNRASSNRPAHWRGLNWIRTHLEESAETSLSKQDIYEDYRSFCEMSDDQVLSTADFGKLVRQAFPKITVRRLGTRGNSKYCYSGINKKTEVRPPSLPNLDVISTHKPGNGSILGGEQQIKDSANFVVCEWASKRFGCSFNTVVDIAKHLVNNNKVQGKSAAAFNLLVEHPSKQMLHKFRTGILTHKETNLHLQRTIQRRQKQKMQSEANNKSNLNSPSKSQTPIAKQVDKSKNDEPMEITCSDYQLKFDSDSGHSRSSDSSFSGSDATTDNDNSSPKKLCSTANHQINTNMDNKERINPKESPNTRKLKPLMPKTSISESQSRPVICVMGSPITGSPMAGTPTRQTSTPVLPLANLKDQTYLQLITIAPNTPIMQDIKGSGGPTIESIKKLPTVVGGSSIPVSCQHLVKTSDTSVRAAIVASPCSVMPNSTTKSSSEGVRVVQGSIQKVTLNSTPSNLTPNISVPAVFSIQQTPISMSSPSEPVPASTASMITCMPPVLTNNPAGHSQQFSISVAGSAVNEKLVQSQGKCLAASLNQGPLSQQNHQRALESESLKQETQKISEQTFTDNSSSATLLKLIDLQKLPQPKAATQEKQNTGQLHLPTGSKSNPNTSLLHNMLVLQNNGSIPEWQNPCSSPSLQVLNSTIPRASATTANANAKTNSASQVVPDSNSSTVYNVKNNTHPALLNSGSMSVPSSPSYLSHSQIAQTSGQQYVIQTLPSPGPSEGNVFSFTPIANTTSILPNGVHMNLKAMPKPKATMGVKLNLSEQNPKLVMCQEAPRQVPKTARQELMAIRGVQGNIGPVRHRRASSSSRKKLNQPYSASKTKVVPGGVTSPGNSRSATPVSPMLSNSGNVQLFQSESESMPPPSPNPVTVEVSPGVAQGSNNLLTSRSATSWGRHRRLSGPPAQLNFSGVCAQLTNNVINRALSLKQSQRSQSVPLPELGYEALIPNSQSIWNAKQNLTQLPQLQVISISEEDFLGSDDQDGTDMSTTNSVSAGNNSMLEHSWDLDGDDPVLTNRNAANTMLTSTLRNTVTEDVIGSGLGQDNLLQQLSTNSSFSGSDNSMDMETTDSLDASTWSLGHFSSLPCGS